VGTTSMEGWAHAEKCRRACIKLYKTVHNTSEGPARHDPRVLEGTSQNGSP
jgi:hypothetical protein